MTEQGETLVDKVARAVMESIDADPNPRKTARAAIRAVADGIRDAGDATMPAGGDEGSTRWYVSDWLRDQTATHTGSER